MTAYDIIKRPIITEQSMEQTEMKRYTFEVAKTANKIEIAKAVEEIFGVEFIIPDNSQFATVIGAALCEIES